VGSACDNITINELIHMVNLLQSPSVEVLIEDVNVNKLIKTAKNKNQFTRIEGNE
jgi:ABC-type lipopolysaccharide export system ATPase subunit